MDTARHDSAVRYRRYRAGLDHDAIRELHSNSHDHRRRRSGSLPVPTSPDIAACAGVANFRALCWRFHFRSDLVRDRGDFTLGHIGIFLLATFLVACTFTAVLVLINSLAFWLGRSEILAEHFLNAMVTFSLYPGTLFDGAARIFLFTLVPAGLTGALPVEMLRNFEVAKLAWLCLGTGIFVGLAILVFHWGLRRYESGSAIQVRI